MHARPIEWILSPGDAEEPGALLESLGAQARNVLERAAAGERTVLVAVRHDALGKRAGDTGDPREQRNRRGVDVDADGVHRVLHDGTE